MPSSRKSAVALGAIAIMVTASCSTAPKATALTVTATTEGSGKNQTFGFDVPSTVTGGRVDLTFDNQGGTQHEAQLLTTTAGKTKEDLLPVLEAEGGPIPEWVGIEGGVAPIDDQDSATTSLNLEAGSYWLVCFIGGHFMKGMLQPFEVTEGETAPLPTTEGTVSAIDYDFELTGLKAGTNTVTFSNDGKQPHFALLLRFEEGVTVADVEAELPRMIADKKLKIPEPEEAGQLSALDPGRSLTTELTLEAGHVYLFVCFLNDREGGPPHIAKGMAKPIEIS